MARLEYLRDQAWPSAWTRSSGGWRRSARYSARGDEQKRRALEQVFGLENSAEGATGASTRRSSTRRRWPARPKTRRRCGREWPRDPALAQAIGDPWATVAASRRGWFHAAIDDTDRAASTAHGCCGIAGQVVEYVAEVEKPNEKRYEEYVDANLDSLRNELLSAAPVHVDLEQATLADQFQLALEQAGPRRTPS